MGPIPPEQPDRLDIDSTQLPGEVENTSDSPTHSPKEAVETQIVSAAASDQPASEQVSDPSSSKKFGRYRVDSLLGQGGFGAVYVGYDDVLNRKVAIKVPRGLHGEDEKAEFLREARRLAQLQDPGIVAVYDVGEEEGFCFIVTEFVSGQSLSSYLKQQQLSWQQSADIVARVANALAHAHARSMIHRDIKPANIMLTDDGRPVLLDFGLALTDIESDGPDELIAGTPAYMAPEQARGEAHRVDGRTDIYALGTVLYEMLTGRRPFRAPNVHEVLRRIEHEEPQPLRQLAPDIPASIEKICQRAMAKSMSDRYTTAGDMAIALRQALPDAVVGSPATTKTHEFAAPEEPSSHHTPVSTSSIRRRREAERRQVTIAVFNFEAGLAGTSLDAEEQHRLSNEFSTLTAESVEALGGVVLAGGGQEVTAAFGYPAAFEDAPQRAVRTALLVKEESTRQFQEAFPDGCVEMWAVVNTGEAVVEDTGSVSTDGISLLGDVRNICARLEPTIDPNTIAITGSTHNLVRDFFKCESLESQKIRGVSDPVDLYSVLSDEGAVSRLELVDPGNLTPLVGRDTELRILLDRWEQAEEGLGQVVLLIGEAGLGKSRLIRELREQVLSQDDLNATVMELRCSPYHQNTGFHSIIQHLSSRLGFESEASPARRLEAIRDFLGRNRLNEGDNVALLSALLTVPTDGAQPALSLAPQKIRELTEELLLDLLRRLAEKAPLLFVVEDLHWVDPSTLQLLSRHVEEFDSGSVMSLLSFRPEFQTPWRSLAHQTQIALNRLTRRQIGALVKQKTGVETMSDRMIQQLVDRTDGIPLFVEEFAQVVAEAIANEADQGQTESMIMETIPSTLKDLLVSRLDRMASNPDVVQMAATIGREFSYPILHAACDLPDVALNNELDKLVAAELLFQKGRPPESNYIFKHALIQDSAYNMMLTTRRHQFHRRIAETIEERFADVAKTQPELLAQHWSEADETDRAISYWLKAGQHSQEQSANHEAVSHFSNGRELVLSLPESPERDGLELGFQLPLGVSLLAARGYASQEAGTALERALELGERVADPATLFYIRWGVWARRLVRSDLKKCRESIEQLLNHADQQDDPSWFCEAHFAPEVVDFYAGDFSASRAHAEAAIERFDPEKCVAHAKGTGQDVRTGVLTFHGMSLWSLGEVDEALRQARHAIEVTRTLNHPMSLGFAFHHAGWVLLLARLWDELRAVADECHQLASDNGLALWESSSLFHRGLCEMHLGEIDSGLEQMHAGCEQFQNTGARCAVPLYFTMLGEGYRRQGDLDQALEWIESSFQWARDTDEQNFYLAETHRVQGDIFLLREEVSTASENYRQALEIARSQSARSFELRAAMSILRLAQRDGDGEAAARQRLQGLYTGWESGLDTPDLIEARELLQHGDHAE